MAISVIAIISIAIINLATKNFRASGLVNGEAISPFA